MGTRDTGDTWDAMIPDGSLFDEPSATNDPAKGTKAFLARPFPTLGERLAREAQHIAGRRLPVFPWLRPLETTMEHLASLPAPAQERFQRFEALPLPASFPDAGMARQVSAAYSPGALPVSTSPVNHADRAHRQAAGLSSSSSDSEAGVRSVPVGGQPLPSHLQQRLRSFVGQGSESIRIHNDAASHALARAHRADAVTVGRYIFFRDGQFQPQEERGFALLTHEALHVVRAMQPGSAWRRATQAGIQEEEQEAAAVESSALAARRNALWEPTPQPLFPARAVMLSGQLPMPRPAEPAPLAAESAASAPVQRPMRASTDRDLVNGAAAAPAMPDMDALKRSLYRDLMRQIKADLERGG